MFMRGGLLFNFGRTSCTTYTVITTSRKENHVVEVFCFEVNKEIDAFNYFIVSVLRKLFIKNFLYM